MCDNAAAMLLYNDAMKANMWRSEENPDIVCLKLAIGWVVIDRTKNKTPKATSTLLEPRVGYPTAETAIVAWRVKGGSY